MGLDVSGEDYVDVNDALKRIGGNEGLYKRLLKRFVDGTEMESLENALNSGDMEEAARFAHTIKGVSANLSLTKISIISTQLEQDIKNGSDYEAGFSELRQAYGVTIDVINEYVA